MGISGESLKALEDECQEICSRFHSGVRVDGVMVLEIGCCVTLAAQKPPKASEEEWDALLASISAELLKCDPIAKVTRIVASRSSDGSALEL